MIGVQLDSMLVLESLCRTSPPQQPYMDQQWTKLQQDVFVPAGLAEEADALTSTLPDLTKGIVPLFQEAMEVKIQSLLEAKITRKVAKMEQLDACSIQSALRKGILQGESAEMLLKKTPQPIYWPGAIALITLGAEALVSATSFGVSYLVGEPLSDNLWGVGFLSAMVFVFQLALMLGYEPTNYNRDILEAQMLSKGKLGM
jgi:hypothetical protein